MPAGEYGPLHGLIYVQVSRLGRGNQKSENGGSGLPPAEPEMNPYHRFASLIPVRDKEASIFDGIDVSLMGIASLAGGSAPGFLKDGLSQINSLVEKAAADFTAQHPEAIAQTLAAGLKATNDLIAKVAGSGLSADSKFDVTHELQVKQAQFENALAESLCLAAFATFAPQKEPSVPFARFFGSPASFQLAMPGHQC